MRNKTILSLLLLTALSLTVTCNDARSAVSVQVGTPNLNLSFSDYQPPPPNVYVQSDRGRPYYMERDRRVYMEKKQHGKKYKKEKKHHENRGHENGHENNGKHGH